MRRYRRVTTKSRQHSSWRRLKVQFKLKKFFRRVALALTVVAAVVLTLGAIYVWKFFTEPFVSAASTFEGGASWDGENPFNLLWLEVANPRESSISTKNLAVVSFNPTKETLAIIDLPVGSEPLGQKDGLSVTARAVTEILGMPIDGYVLVGEKGVLKLKQLFPQDGNIKELVSLGNVFQLPAVWGIARENLATSLDLPEIFHALWYLYKVRSDRISSINPSQELLDDPTALDRKLAPILQDKKILDEHLKIQVLNGSDKPGLASSAARIIKNIGGEVIRVDNFERQDLVRGYLILESSGSYTARRLAQIFDVFDSRPPRTGSEARANITLILGSENSR